MFSPTVNTPCNNGLFTLSTMAAMKEKAIHASIRRLYSVAGAAGDDAPAKVARRLNISAQVMNNWEARGISQAGSLVAQDAYGCNAVWLTTGKGGQAQPNKPAPDSHSHLVRLDPVMLAETHRVLRELYHERGQVYSLEDPTGATWFVKLYAMRVAMPAQPSQDEWVQFGRKLATITTPQGVGDGRSDGVPVEGTGTKRVAGGVRRRKA